MPQLRLDLGNAAELAEMLTFRADLHRFAFLLGETDGEELFGEPCRLPTPEGDAP